MAGLQDFIAEHVPKINQQLKAYLKPLLPDERRILEDAMGYSFAGGKRLRPLLAIASYSLFDQASTKILPFCCAIEIFHTYTLIHDDLPALDNDDYRRGQITNHKKFSEDMAILAGALIHVTVYSTYVWMVGRAGVVFATQVSYLVTGFGVVWAMLLLGERYSGWVWAAMAVMFVGLFLIQPRRRDEIG